MIGRNVGELVIKDDMMMMMMMIEAAAAARTESCDGWKRWMDVRAFVPTNSSFPSPSLARLPLAFLAHSASPLSPP